MSSKERLVTAQWVFERTLSWIAAAEIKVGFVVTIDTAMLGGLAAAFGGAPTKSAWACLFTVSCATSLIIALGCAAAAVTPRLDGPSTSLLYFGKVADLERSEFVERFRNATDDELLSDWSEQVHRNAEIARLKHSWVRKAMGWSAFGAMPWIPAIALLAAR